MRFDKFNLENSTLVDYLQLSLNIFTRNMNCVIDLNLSFVNINNLNFRDLLKTYMNQHTPKLKFGIIVIMNVGWLLETWINPKRLSRWFLRCITTVLKIKYSSLDK